MRRIPIAFITLLLLPASPLLARAADAKTAACAGCHGANGEISSDTVPRLAGQVPQYLEKQLRDFRNGARKDCAAMPAGAPPLSDADIAEIASYFASRPVGTAAGERVATAAGENLYLKGRRSPAFVPACIGCHGMSGLGKANWQQVMSRPPSILPSSIGGQSPRYIAHELEAFRSGSRKNDGGAIMRNLAVQLTDADIAAVATYVAGLR